MNKFSAVLAGALAAAIAGHALANEGAVPQGIPHYDHIFVIMMENHTYQQVVGNPTFPYLNNLINSNKVNVGTSYYAVGHPSFTNYLEIVGGSNFGIRSDNPPDWHNLNCRNNLQTGLPNADIDTLNGKAPVPVDSSPVSARSGALAPMRQLPRSIAGTRTTRRGRRGLSSCWSVGN